MGREAGVVAGVGGKAAEAEIVAALQGIGAEGDGHDVAQELANRRRRRT